MEVIKYYIEEFRKNPALIIYCNKSVYEVLKSLLTTEELKRVRYERQ